MAVTPPKNDVFMREVDEELRRDQMMEFGRRFGLLIGAAVVIALIAIAGVLYWHYHEQTVAGAKGEQFQTAINALGSNNAAGAAAPLSALADSRIDGYRAMARFTQGDILLQKNDLKGAAAKFAAIANDGSLAKPFRDLALVRETAAEFDTLTPQAVVDRLRPLAVKGSPWLGSAGEMVAIAYLQMNRRDLAGDLFAQIAADPTVPDTLHQRAVQMASVLNAAPALTPAPDDANEEKTVR